MLEKHIFSDIDKQILFFFSMFQVMNIVHIIIFIQQLYKLKTTNYKSVESNPYKYKNNNHINAYINYITWMLWQKCFFYIYCICSMLCVYILSSHDFDDVGLHLKRLFHKKVLMF